MTSRGFKKCIFYYDRWDTFKKDLYDQLDAEDLYSGKQYPKYIFRGQRNHTWKLQATFFRSIEHIVEDRRGDIYDSMLERFKGQLKKDKEYRHLFLNDDGDITPENVEQLARHYELPSKLTDWSESPYIAAFFAFSKFLDEDLFPKSDPHSGLKKFVGVWALKMKKEKDENSTPKYKEEKSRETREKESKKIKIFEGDTLLGSNPRLRGQRGWFVQTKGDLERDLKIEECVTHEVEGLTLFAISAEKKEVLRALEDLDWMGITYASLYTGITGYVEHAKMKMQMDIVRV